MSHGHSTRLSEREWQVATLVSRGLSNRQIGQALVISERTVDTHVSNILRKLQMVTRAQIAVWVVQCDREPIDLVSNVRMPFTVTVMEAAANLANY